MMLAKQSPWSIVYPTLVDVNANDDKPSEELQHILGCLVMEILFIKLLVDALDACNFIYHINFII